MSFKSKIRCFSEKNTMSEYKNFRLYVDGISYPNTGRYFETEHHLKGKRHVYALVKGDSNKKVCSFFSDEQLNDCFNQSRKETVARLTDMMVGAANAAGSENSGAHSAVMIYIENGEVYMAGFGEAGVYAFSEDMKTAQRFTVSQEDVKAVYIGNQEKCSKYLLFVSPEIESVPASRLTEFFSDDTSKAIDVYEEASGTNADEHLVVTAVSIEREAGFFNIRLVIACVIALILAVLSSIAVFNGWFGKSNEPADDFREEEIVQNEVQSDGEEEAQEPVFSGAPLSQLEPELERIAFEISGENSRVSYYIKNLATGEILSKNSSQMCSSDMINLYVMAEIYRQLQSSELSADASIDKLLESAIVFNDFTSANELIKTAGGTDINAGYEKITQNALQEGCAGTALKTALQSSDMPCNADGNVTTVEDCARLLEKIYSGTLVSAEYSDLMCDLLAKSTPENKIMKYIPADNVYFINKTGEAANVQNDAAIIYTDKCDYIICVMINDFSGDGNGASEVIARMSKVVYDFLTVTG